MTCWHPSVTRCQRCMLENPAEAAEPIAWERRELSPQRRFFGTLGSAFRPMRSAPAFAGGDVRSAWRFALLTIVPAALLGGIVPHTRTLLFEGLSIEVLGKVTSFEIAFDVVRAMLVELLLSCVRIGCLFFPYVSLVRAYGPAERHLAAARALLYRGWLLPTSMLFSYLAIWMLPPADQVAMGEAPALWFFIAGVDLTSRVLLMMTMGATARLACGMGPWISFVVVIIPVTLQLVVEQVVPGLVTQLLPAMPVQAGAPAPIS
jgi:hypothetical protein